METKNTVINKKTKEVFNILNYSIIGLLFGGTYTLGNVKTGEIIQVTGNKFMRKFKTV